MKNKPVSTKRTYAKSELWILVLQEAFKRDLTLFHQLVNPKEGFFYDNSKALNDWTFTVVQEDGVSTLIVNKPTKKS